GTSSFLEPTTFVLECLDPENRWRPVTMMARQDAFYRNSFGNIYGDANGRSSNARFGDPRTDRFSTGHAETQQWEFESTSIKTHDSQKQRFRHMRAALPS